jgi:hypothetical protein
MNAERGQRRRGVEGPSEDQDADEGRRWRARIGRCGACIPSPDRWTSPFRRPIPALEDRGRASRGRSVIPAVRVEGDEAGVTDGLEVGAVGEPDVGGEVGVAEGGPVVAGVLFLRGGLGLGEQEGWVGGWGRRGAEGGRGGEFADVG